MTITKSLNPNALASAATVAFKQLSQNIGAIAREERIAVLGQPKTGASFVDYEVKNLFSADDVASRYGYGSPLHRMAIKLFPLDGNGAKVPVYFIPIPPATGAIAQVDTISTTGTPTKNATLYLRFNELVFEAPADVVGKIATNYQLNPAKAPRKLDLNIFNKVKIPFTILKNATALQISTALMNAVNNTLEIPFTASLSSNNLVLTAKWADLTSAFTVDFVDEDDNIVHTNNYGFYFTITVTESAGIPDIQPALDSITDELGITRIVSQFADNSSLDKLQTKVESLRDPIICQWALAYTGKAYPKDGTTDKVDITALQTFGDGRLNDSSNVIIAGDWGDLKPLNYTQRDTLLKSGISNLEPRTEGGYRIGDLITLYHPLGQKLPLFRYDRDITVIGNIGYDLFITFNYGDEWKSIIIVSDNLVSSNDAARSVKDLKAAIDTKLRNYGDNAWIADVDYAIANSKVELDKSNPNRFNINPVFELSGVGRVYDITNFVGFYFGTL
jgi:hypothetical protein